MKQKGKKMGVSKQMIDKTSFNHLEGLVSFRLRLLANLYTKASASAYERSFGLTLNEWRIIALLSSGGNLSISRLADQAQFDRGPSIQAQPWHRPIINRNQLSSATQRDIYRSHVFAAEA